MSYFSAKPKSTNTGTGGSEAVSNIFAGLERVMGEYKAHRMRVTRVLYIIVYNATSM